MINEVSAINNRLLVTDEYRESVDFAKRATSNKFAMISKVFGILWALKVNITIFPTFLSEFINNMLTDYNTTTFINLNASKIDYVFNGKKMTGAPFYYAFGMGNLSITMILLTVGQKCSFTVYSDYNKIKNPKMFVEMFNKHLQSQLTQQKL